MDELAAENLLELVWTQRLNCLKRIPFKQFLFFRAAARNAKFRHISFTDKLLYTEEAQVRSTSGYREVKAYMSKFETCPKMQTFAADIFYVVLTTKTHEFRTMQEFLDYADGANWEDFYAHMCHTIFVCKGLAQAHPSQQRAVAKFMQEWHDVVKAVIARNAEPREKEAAHAGPLAA